MDYIEEGSIDYDKSDSEDSDSQPQQRLTAVDLHSHDIIWLSYDYYGHRLVTCGVDQKIKIWKKMDLKKPDDSSPKMAWSPNATNRFNNEFDYLASPILKKNISNTSIQQGMWLTEEWNAHSGPMWKVAWAHPQYGQVFASCAESSELFIWEEKIKRKPGTSHDLIRSWENSASLKVSRSKIQTIVFSPEHCGLKLLVLYKNGGLTIFQAKVVTNLKKWETIWSSGNYLHLHLDCVNKNGWNSVDWNPDQGMDMFVVASNSNKGDFRLDQLDDQEGKRRR